MPSREWFISTVKLRSEEAADEVRAAFRRVVRIILTSLAWHRRAAERAYAPGGIGYEVAAASTAVEKKRPAPEN